MLFLKPCDSLDLIIWNKYSKNAIQESEAGLYQQSPAGKHKDSMDTDFW